MTTPSASPEPGRPSRAAAPRIPLRQSTDLTPADRRGMRWWGRLLLVVAAELLVLAWVGIWRADLGFFPLGYPLVAVSLALGLIITVQAHHRLPVAWHVVVVLGFAASMAIAPWTGVVLDDQRADRFTAAYWGGLGWASLVIIEIACLLALLRPAGSSYVTQQMVARERGAG